MFAMPVLLGLNILYFCFWLIQSKHAPIIHLLLESSPNRRLFFTYHIYGSSTNGSIWRPCEWGRAPNLLRIRVSSLENRNFLLQSTWGISSSYFWESHNIINDNNNNNSMGHFTVQHSCPLCLSSVWNTFRFLFRTPFLPKPNLAHSALKDTKLYKITSSFRCLKVTC